MKNYAELIVLALASLNDFHNPESKSFRLKNPIMLKNYAPEGRHPTDEDGVRVYKSALSGLKSSVVDVEKKLSGTSITGLRQDQPLRNLLKVLGVKTSEGQTFVVRFLRKAINQEVSLDTPLLYFYEGKN